MENGLIQLMIQYFQRISKAILNIALSFCVIFAPIPHFSSHSYAQSQSELAQLERSLSIESVAIQVTNLVRKSELAVLALLQQNSFTVRNAAKELGLLKLEASRLQQNLQSLIGSEIGSSNFSVSLRTLIQRYHQAVLNVIVLDVSYRKSLSQLTSLKDLSRPYQLSLTLPQLHAHFPRFQNLGLSTQLIPKGLNRNDGYLLVLRDSVLLIHLLRLSSVASNSVDMPAAHFSWARCQTSLTLLSQLSDVELFSLQTPTKNEIEQLLAGPPVCFNIPNDDLAAMILPRADEVTSRMILFERSHTVTKYMSKDLQQTLLTGSLNVPEDQPVSAGIYPLKDSYPVLLNLENLTATVEYPDYISGTIEDSKSLNASLRRSLQLFASRLSGPEQEFHTLSQSQSFNELFSALTDTNLSAATLAQLKDQELLQFSIALQETIDSWPEPLELWKTDSVQAEILNDVYRTTKSRQGVDLMNMALMTQTSQELDPASVEAVRRNLEQSIVGSRFAPGLLNDVPELLLLKNQRVGNLAALRTFAKLIEQDMTEPQWHKLRLARSPLRLAIGPHITNISPRLEQWLDTIENPQIDWQQRQSLTGQVRAVFQKNAEQLQLTQMQCSSQTSTVARAWQATKALFSSAQLTEPQKRLQTEYCQFERYVRWTGLDKTAEPVVLGDVLSSISNDLPPKELDAFIAEYRVQLRLSAYATIRLLEVPTAPTQEPLYKSILNESNFAAQSADVDRALHATRQNIFSQLKTLIFAKTKADLSFLIVSTKFLEIQLGSRYGVQGAAEVRSSLNVSKAISNEQAFKVAQLPMLNYHMQLKRDLFAKKLARQSAWDNLVNVSMMPLMVLFPMALMGLRSGYIASLLNLARAPLQTYYSVLIPMTVADIAVVQLYRVPELNMENLLAAEASRTSVLSDESTLLAAHDFHNQTVYREALATEYKYRIVGHLVYLGLAGVLSSQTIRTFVANRLFQPWRNKNVAKRTKELQAAQKASLNGTATSRQINLLKSETIKAEKAVLFSNSRLRVEFSTLKIEPTYHPEKLRRALDSIRNRPGVTAAEVQHAERSYLEILRAVDQDLSAFLQPVEALSIFATRAQVWFRPVKGSEQHVLLFNQIRKDVDTALSRLGALK